MKTIRSRVRARLASAVAVAAAATLAFTGLPGLTSSADAAPKPPNPGMLCRDYFDLAEDLVAIVEMPDGDASRAKSQWDTYEYENPGKKWDGLQGPSEAEYKRLELETKEPPKSRPVDRVWWKWIRASKKNPNAFGDFTYWRDIILIKNAGNDPRGKAFEKKIIKEHGLVGDDWICQKEFDFTDPDTGKTYRRQADVWNKSTGQQLEIKSNGHPDPKQKPGDIAWSKQKESPVKSLKYVFAEPQEKSAKDHLNELKKNAPGKVTEYNYRSRKAELAPGGGVRDKSTTMQPPGSKGVTGGGAQDLIRESRPTPKDMKEFVDRKNAADPNRLQPKGPGGVDFTTLELRYIGKPVKGKGVDYSFSAKEVPEDTAGWGGKEKAQLINDAFFTWLALTPEKFWVNLNPDQPDKIMDSAFGKTDAGRILLEADLELKRDFADAMNPKKRPEADQYWKSLPRNAQGIPCWFQVRNWIEPDTAVVREENGGIHILDTPLKVKAQYLKIDNMPGDPYLCEFNEAEKKATEDRMNRLIMPEVERRVNNDPRYAELRRVYTARVAAEFIRQQDAKTPTDYHKVINSNDVSSWPLRGENKDWTRESVYQAYLKSLREGEQQWEHDAGGGPYTMSVGGVDFSKQPKRNMTKPRFDTEHRYLPRETKSSVRTLTDNAKDGEKNLLLLGGNTVSSDLSGGDTSDPKPTPTPTPTKPGEPTDKPTDPTTPPATGGSSGGTGGKNPQGDLADTGSSTPVGMIAGLAAALAAIGGGLVWWKRRRTADQE